ncbi:CWF19-like protein 2 [Myzus persicae]|uniref:CWF19-like protein 2 n=1 Tax=Myzus persicae TaxID=13164 RepID=UPI000B9391E4|nr:CWF19-like protein 2 [Myzus persicae]
MGKKSHKKEHKKSTHKKKKHRSSSSSSSTSNDDQWVEKHHKDALSTSTSFAAPKEEPDNWMDFVCNTSSEIEKKVSTKSKELEEAKARMIKPGQSERELNPYWKNGGTGLPPPKPLSGHKGFLKPKVDDDDDYHHYKSHQHTSYSKPSYGRQSWKKHDRRDNVNDNKYTASKRDNEERYKRPREFDERKEERDKHHREFDERKEERDKHHREFDERKEERNKHHREFDERDRRHRDYDEERNRQHKEYNNESKGDKDKRYREHEDERKSTRDKYSREYDHKKDRKSKYDKYSDNEEKYTSDDEKYEEKTLPKKYSDNNDKTKEHKESVETPLTESELNALAAKQIKAEIMGNKKLAEELKQKLELAREHTSKQNYTTNKTKQKDDFVLLTRTSSKGYSYPVKQAQVDKNDGRKKKREKVLTHEDGKRVRYFDDDDKYSLKSMFEKEITTTAEDSNMEFVNLSRKVNARDDEDDVFVDRASEKRSAKASEREIKRAIGEHKRTEKILNSCRYCFDSEEMLKHLFIAKGEKCYLCLPSYKSLTEGHCLIVPIYHYACATDIDEDVWTEMQVFRKVLTTMFKDQDEDVIFFESAMRLNNMPHMTWNCVPVPIEIGDTAPIYFKKAILECETEWAINVKVVDLSTKDVRRAVPKSLPYFAVDFGMQGGYAHVIEDEKVFPNNFAEEIIGGMMDLDHNAWRKRQKEPIEEQLQKTTKFLEIWKDYNFTKT